MNAKTSAKMKQVKVLKTLAKQLEAQGDTSGLYSRNKRNESHISLGYTSQSTAYMIGHRVQSHHVDFEANKIERLHKFVEEFANDCGVKIVTYDVTEHGYLMTERVMTKPGYFERFLSFLFKYVFGVWSCVKCGTVNSRQRTGCWQCKYNRLIAIWSN